MERDAALHKRLSGLSHLTYVGQLQPVTRCCYHPIMYPDNSMYPWNPVRSGQRRSESVLRLARRSSKAGARRSSSSADWGSTVRPKTRSGCIHDAHACGRRGGSALHVCTSSWQVMLLVNASRMIERRLNKIARLHARQHAQSRPPGCGRAGHLWLEAPTRLHAAALCAPEQSLGCLRAVQPWSLLSAAPSATAFCHPGAQRCRGAAPRRAAWAVGARGQPRHQGREARLGRRRADGGEAHSWLGVTVMTLQPSVL